METLNNGKILLGIEEVSALLGISERAFRMRLHRRTGVPAPLRLGGRLCWRPVDVEAWLEKEAAAQGVAYSQQSNEPNGSKKRGRPRKV